MFKSIILSYYQIFEFHFEYTKNIYYLIKNVNWCIRA